MEKESNGQHSSRKGKEDPFYIIPKGDPDAGSRIVKNQKIVRWTFDTPLTEGYRKSLLTESYGVSGFLRTNPKQRTALEKVRIIKSCSCASENTILCLVEGPGLHELANNELQIQPGPGVPPPTTPSASDNHVGSSAGSRSAGSSRTTPKNTTFAVLSEKDKAGIKAHNKALGDAIPVVAIIDTGFDHTFDRRKFLTWASLGAKPEDIACASGTITGDDFGWNFISNNSNFFDDDPGKHGTHLAAYITRVAQKAVKVVPLKVFDKKGIGLMFDMLCCLEYLKQRRDINIVNGSFGYWSVTGNALMREQLEAMPDKLFLFAAGNTVHNRPQLPKDIGGTAPNDPRKFFPACLSGELDNVLAVTTVSTHSILLKKTAKKEVLVESGNTPLGETPLTVLSGGDMLPSFPQPVRLSWRSPAENFSGSLVNVGVAADHRAEFRPVISSPAATVAAPLRGSSFATGILSGLAARLWPTFVGGTKTAFMDQIRAMGDQDPMLSGYVKDRLYWKPDVL